MTAPWLEEWDVGDEMGRTVTVRVDSQVIGSMLRLIIPAPLGSVAGNRAVTRLAAAAPALVRALLDVEWVCSPSCDAFCPGCDADNTADMRRDHRVGCSTDAALTLAGLPDQASRDEARELRGPSK